VLFELSYPDSATAHQALNRAVQKLPIKARVISREEMI
jgi:large subunit ribosomal protein L16